MAITTKPISSLSITNIQKQQQLFDIFEITKLIKNHLSSAVRDQILLNPSLSPRDFRNPDFLDQVQLDFDKNFKYLKFIYKSEKTFNQISPLTRHEFADLSHATADLYLNQLKQLMSNSKINSYKSIKYIKHKKVSNEKSKIKYKAGEIKSIHKIPVNNVAIYKYLLYINMDKIENKEFNIEHLKEKK